MKMREAVTLWTPKGVDLATTGKAAVQRLGTTKAMGEEFLNSGGAAYTHIATETDFVKSSRWALIEFVTMVVRDGIDPQVAHAALLDIDEYAASISLDTPGARQGEEMPLDRE